MEIRIYMLSNGEVFVDNNDSNPNAARQARERAEETHSILYKRVITIRDYTYNDNLWFGKEYAAKRGLDKPL